jgi:hypothetical protein
VPSPGTGGPATIPQATPGASSAPPDAARPSDNVLVPSLPGEVPRIDLEATKRRAREIENDKGARGVLPLMRIPEYIPRKPTFEEEMAKAVKPDCRQAYAEWGLLAIPPLIWSSIANGTCRW